MLESKLYAMKHLVNMCRDERRDLKHKGHSMRKLLLATVALSAFSFPAIAADLPVRGPAPAPSPVFVGGMNWTGFYVGAQIGYTWAKDGTTEFITATGLPSGFAQGFRPDGIVGGLHAGFNYQTGSIVLGVEADIEAAGIKGGYRIGGVTGNDSDRAWQGSLRARLGVSFGQALLYATGGLAIADNEYTQVNGLVREGGFSKTQFGYTVGAGLEYAFTNNWSARLEYRYTDFGDFRYNSLVAFPGFSYRHEPSDSTVRAGVSYRFGSARPVMARY